MENPQKKGCFTQSDALFTHYFGDNNKSCAVAFFAARSKPLQTACFFFVIYIKAQCVVTNFENEDDPKTIQMQRRHFHQQDFDVQ
jgi:hypothetical protein